MYPWIVFLHVLAVFGFLLAHGTSASVAFALRRERNVERIRALLNLSKSAYSAVTVALMLLFITGIIAGFMGSWWGKAWIWIALGLLIVLAVAMSIIGSQYFNEVRKAVGLPSLYEKGQEPMSEPLSAEEIDALLTRLRSRPVLLTGLGFGGVSIIAWLMMFKPF